MRIYEVSENKKKYMELLFLADEQEDMIERYLEKGTMYVLEDDGIKGECVVTEEDRNVLEIKNLAVVPDCHKKRIWKSFDRVYCGKIQRTILYFAGRNRGFSPNHSFL